MSTWSPDDTSEGAPKRLLVSATLEEATGGRERPTPQMGLVTMVVGAVDIIWRRLTGRRRPETKAPRLLRAGTALATEAAAGKLEGASLEGELKKAEITNLYAEARLKNAQAAQLEQTTEAEAWGRVERALNTFVALGIPVAIAQLPTGELAILVGDLLLDPARGTATRVEQDGRQASQNATAILIPPPGGPDVAGPGVPPASGASPSTPPPVAGDL